MPKIQNIYSTPEIYDALHWWKTNDQDFIGAWAKAIGGPTLELAAGTGRLALPILHRGLSYTGLEQSPDFVRVARAKLAAFSDRAQIVEGDMRSFSLGQKYKTIFIGFNSFLHLSTDADALACLNCIRDHLDPRGRFLVEMFVPNPDFLYDEDDAPREISSFAHPAGGYCTIKETKSFDPETEILAVQWYFYRPLEKEPQRFDFDMRMYYPDTLDRLLTEAGLKIIGKYGGRDKTPLDEDSTLQIYECEI